VIGDRDSKNKEVGQLNKQIGELKKAKKDADNLIAQRDALKKQAEDMEKDIDALEKVIKNKVNSVGNYVADDVPVSDVEDKDNKVVKTWGPIKEKGNHLYHHELLHMIGGYDAERGVKVVGARGYFLKGVGVLLNQALINFGLAFLYYKDYIPLQPPYFMKQSVMAETAQLSQFDEELYKVPSDVKEEGEDGAEDCYLIATSEQPISAYFLFVSTFSFF
jgi:seryl-tRNA synthetase